MRSFLCICLIVVLFLFTTTCNIRQFIPQKEKYGAIYEGQNLIPNANIEILDNGQPLRWNYQGNCGVGVPGFQSDHALAMASGQDVLAKWEAQVDSIKPYTKYIISFWYRLPEKGRIAFK